MLVTIYILSAFIFIFLFKDGFSRLTHKTHSPSYVPLFLFSIFIHVAFIFIYNASTYQMLNCLFNLFVALLVYLMARSFYSSNKALLYACF